MPKVVLYHALGAREIGHLVNDCVKTEYHGLNMSLGRPVTTPQMRHGEQEQEQCNRCDEDANRKTAQD